MSGEAQGLRKVVAAKGRRVLEGAAAQLMAGAQPRGESSREGRTTTSGEDADSDDVDWEDEEEDDDGGGGAREEIIAAANLLRAQSL